MIRKKVEISSSGLAKNPLSTKLSTMEDLERVFFFPIFIEDVKERDARKHT